MWRRTIFAGLVAAALPASGQAQSFGQPAIMDPVSHDSIELFSRLCLSTRGDRARATAIVGNNDSNVEKLDDASLLQLEGKPGGVGWVIRMPLGEKILVEFQPDGACVVRAPQVKAFLIENALGNLLDQISASGQFKVKRLSDREKTIEKSKYHFIVYNVRLPDGGRIAEVGVATTEAKGAFSATLNFLLLPEQP
jgi:hypothetical protein